MSQESQEEQNRILATDGAIFDYIQLHSVNHILVNEIQVWILKEQQRLREKYPETKITSVLREFNKMHWVDNGERNQPVNGALVAVSVENTNIDPKDQSNWSLLFLPKNNEGKFVSMSPVEAFADKYLH